jgi:hypothetical protein
VLPLRHPYLGKKLETWSFTSGQASCIYRGESGICIGYKRTIWTSSTWIYDHWSLFSSRSFPDRWKFWSPCRLLLAETMPATSSTRRLWHLEPSWACIRDVYRGMDSRVV